MRRRLLLPCLFILALPLGCEDTRALVARDASRPPPPADAAADAVTPPPPPRDGGGGSGEGALRIVGESRGRLEVFHDGQWGTICDDLFDEVDATVACRQLGFSSGTYYTDGAGSGPIWMDDVECSGLESRLVDCPFLGWGIHNCGHNEDVGVDCL